MRSTINLVEASSHGAINHLRRSHRSMRPAAADWGSKRASFASMGSISTSGLCSEAPKSPPSSIRAVCKIGELGTPPALTAMDKGRPIQGHRQRRAARAPCNISSRVRNCLPGRTSTARKLGVLSRGSCSDWYMREVLRHYGLDPETDVTIVGLGPALSGNPHVAGARRPRRSDHFGAACHHRRAGRTLQGMARASTNGMSSPGCSGPSRSQTTRRWSMTAISSRPCLRVSAQLSVCRGQSRQNGQISAPAISASRATPWRSRSIASSAICISIVRSIARGWKRPLSCSVSSEA